MSTWYMTRRYSTQIEPIEFVRETPKQVVWMKKVWALDAKGNRFVETKSPKEGAFENFFPTWEDAHQHLLKHFEDRVANARLQLERVNGDLGNVKGMKPPVKEAA